MSSFLIDENLSPLLAEYMRGLNYDALSVREAGLKGKSDIELIKWIQRKNAILITCDLDFGEFFYGQSLGQFGVIILRSKLQKYKASQEVIEYLHKENILKDRRLNKSLLIAIKGHYRWRKFI